MEFKNQLRVLVYLVVFAFMLLLSFDVFLLRKIYDSDTYYKDRFSRIELEMSLISKAVRESQIVSVKTKKQLKDLENKLQNSGTTQDEKIVQAVARASKSTVSIVASKYVELLKVQYVDPFGDGLSPFKIPVYKRVGVSKHKIGAGTGFVINENGYIITNKHVVFDSNAEYTALLQDGRQLKAKVVYKDPIEDLAILKVSGSNFAPIVLGDSDKAKLGQTVIAIGNALGEYDNSVSIGIISGLHRNVRAIGTLGIEYLKDLIQTDAAINEGNSGGPLVDINGKVLGVNVATAKSANDIGFAIPVNRAKKILRKLGIKYYENQ